jgi:hypothetical protein
MQIHSEFPMNSQIVAHLVPLGHSVTVRRLPEQRPACMLESNQPPAMTTVTSEHEQTPFLIDFLEHKNRNGNHFPFLVGYATDRQLWFAYLVVLVLEIFHAIETSKYICKDFARHSQNGVAKIRFVHFKIECWAECNFSMKNENDVIIPYQLQQQ